MLWPSITPFFSTCALALAATVAAIWRAPRFGRSRIAAFISACGFWLVAFIPCCVVIELAIHPLRFGTFRYDSGDEIGDWRVERYFPTAAREITLLKYPSGFRAEFRIGRAELEAWIDDRWAAFGDRSMVPRSAPETLDAERVRLELRDAPDGGFMVSEELRNASAAILFTTPVAGNGAGVSFVLDPVSGRCFAEAGYW
jgi:hypothetical protein